MRASAIPLIVIAGPTASGKTALSTELFLHKSSSVEIINADSVQVYTDIPIASALPSKETRAQFVHHLIDFCPPQQEFSVADFVRHADACCKQIFLKKKMPVMIGGTGFFIKNFLYGLPKTPSSDKQIRAELQKRAQLEGVEALFNELSKLDPERAQQIHPNDAYRIIRALEIYYATGKPLSYFVLNTRYRSKYDVFFVLVDLPRAELHRRIEIRAEQMLRAGLQDEFKKLYQKGIRAEDPVAKAIGVREFFAENPANPPAADSENVAMRIIASTKKYAKRQQTYFKQCAPDFTLHSESDEQKAALKKALELFFKKHLL